MQKWREKEEKLKKLSELFKNQTTLLIVMQDNPDPDSIGSACALRKLANTIAGIQCSIIHGGTVGRSENRALVRYLGLNLRDHHNIDYAKFDLIAMVDTQPGFGNNFFPEDIKPDIVIDHHPVNKNSRSCKFTDIRQRYGATSSMMYEYLKIADIEPETKLATALLYGIRSDTQDLGRDCTKADIDALHELYKYANTKALSNIQRGKVRRDYFQMLSNALGSAKAYPNSIISSLGKIQNPDMIAEVADMLLRDDETEWALVYGITQDRILISIRTSQDKITAEKAIKKIIARRGTGGGHVSYAGGQLPLKTSTKKEIANLEKVIKEKFLSAINETSQRSVPLIQYDKPVVE